jgi:hypothetical protein
VQLCPLDTDGPESESGIGDSGGLWPPPKFNNFS